jgi:DNA-binding Lrp family transcriptional regulator
MGKNDLGLRYGIGISKRVPKNMQEFRRKMANLNETEYPEMLREITAFVLMNVSAKKEIRIVDKLFSLAEVKEVHSVHGSVDVIAKIVLSRDLISSDAETIGDFVHNKIRKIAGVVSTQTLIPGYSKQKSNDKD